MEILKKATEFQSGEGVAWNESEANVREEVLRRSHKAGYTEKDGTIIQTGAGKGSRSRIVDTKKFQINYDRVFGKKR